MGTQKHQRQETKEKKRGIIKELTQKITNAKNLKEILTDEKVLKPKGLADEVAKELKDDLKSTQLRKVFDKLKEVEYLIESGKEYKSRILELYPKLAYSTGRKLMPKKFYELLVELLDRAEKNREDAERVIKFITAIVAYSKFYSREE